MAFLYEEKLKQMFWEKYGKRKQIIAYQFENTSRKGGIDLVTVESFNDKFEICAFEFKLSDISKAILQARENIQYVHKSFIVIPSEKKRLIMDKYIDELTKIRHIGVITVSENGTWEIIHKPYARTDIIFSQEIMRILFIKKLNVK